MFVGCSRTHGITKCDSLVKATCKKENGLWTNADKTKLTMYGCTTDLNDQKIEYENCYYDARLGVTRCCESHTGNDRMCRHFIVGDDSKDAKAEWVQRHPNWS